jgi:hypothetical protein
MVSTGLRITPLPAEGALPAFQSDGMFLTDRPARPTAITKVGIDQAFVVGCGVADGAKWAIAAAELTASTGIPIDTRHILGGEENL